MTAGHGDPNVIRVVAFSVLDLSPIPAGLGAREALDNTIRLAEHAEHIGAKRYWLAEHHNAASLASSSPEILISQVAARTAALRVGAGGVMLLNHASLKVAETFRVLEALFPGRIDLGLGRAPGTDPRTARALRRDLQIGPERFEEQLRELLDFLTEAGGPRPARPSNVVAIPAGVPAPEIFILSSSDHGASVAGANGLGLAFAHHMNPADAISEISRYRALFRPSSLRSRPYTIASMSVIVAESDARADALASSARLALVRMMQGQRDLPLASEEEASSYAFDDEERAVLAAFEPSAVIGGPARVRALLEAFVAASGVDEIMIVTNVHDHAARCESYSRAAEIVASLES